MAYANESGIASQPKPGDDKVVEIEFDNMANDYIEVKVVGIPTEHSDKAIIACIYVIDGEKLYYLDECMTLEYAIGKAFNELK